MKKLLLATLACMAINFCFAQAKIDLSKDPTSSNKPLLKQSNAEILSESKEQAETKEQEAYSPSPDASNTDGNYKNHLQVAPSPNNLNLGTEPSMMNTQKNSSQLGNMNTNSTIYYDNSGKIRSTSTTIKLGNK